MIEHLFKRRIIRDFLTKYSTNQWPQVFADVFEIGVLNLQNSFHTLYFSKETFQNIIYDLKEQLRQGNKQQGSDGPLYTQQMKTNKIALKPSKNWRSGDPPEYNTEIQKDLRDDYSNQSDDSEEGHNRRNRRIQKSNTRPSKAEIYVRNDDEIFPRSNSNSKSRPKKEYQVNQHNVKETNRENNQRVQSIESKIKMEVNNDKTTHQFIKNQSNKEKEQINNLNSKTTNANPGKIDTNQKNVNKVNYAINYDKQLKPESIQKKTKKNDEVVFCNKKNKNKHKKIPTQNSLSEYKESCSNARETEEMQNVDQEQYNQNSDMQTNPRDYDNIDEEEQISLTYSMNNSNNVNDNEHMRYNSDNYLEGRESQEMTQGNNMKSIDDNDLVNEERQNQNDEGQNYQSVDKSEIGNNIQYQQQQRQNNFNEGSQSSENKNGPLYYEIIPNDYSKYQSSGDYNQMDENESYRNNYNKYIPSGNSQGDQEEDEKEYYQNNAYEQPQQCQHINELVKEPSYNPSKQHLDNQQHQYRKEQNQYENYPDNRKEEYLDQTNKRTYQHNQPEQYYNNQQVIDPNIHSSARNSNMYINRQYYQAPNLNKNKNEQIINNQNNLKKQYETQSAKKDYLHNDEQYTDQEQQNSHEISFRQTNPENNEFAGQLSMLNVSDRTKTLFKKEMKNWNPEEESRYKHSTNSNASQNKNANSNTSDAQNYQKNRYAYQMEATSNYYSTSGDQKYTSNI